MTKKELTIEARRLTGDSLKVRVLDWLLRATWHLPNWFYVRALLRGFLFALFIGAVFEGAAKGRRGFKA